MTTRNCFPFGAKLLKVFGGLDRFTHVRLENEPYMVLCVERIGIGPRNFPLVSVAHYYEQNGDMMKDPDMTFEIANDCWYPVSYQQDNMSLYQEAVWQDAKTDQVLVRPKLQRSLSAFARQWSKNLVDQGFLARAVYLAAITVQS